MPSARGLLSASGSFDRILLSRFRTTINRNSINESKLFSVRQMKAARALLAWSQGDLAEASGVSEPTIARLESADGPVGGRPETGESCALFWKAGVEFIAENGGGAASAAEATAPFEVMSHLETALDGRRERTSLAAPRRASRRFGKFPMGAGIIEP